jgi:3-oxoacyl-[acyl-carrier protein] reductase
MDLELRDRSALITGGSAGIGLGCALSLAAEGCHVHLVSRDAGKLARARDQIEAVCAVRVDTTAADFSRPEEAGQVVAAARDVDILVNNAGAIPGGSITDIDSARWRVGWELKLFGYIDATRQMLAHMYDRRSGVIVNIIGTGGQRHSYEYVAGSTANSALMAFTNAVGSRSVDYGVRVVGVNPGAVDTDRHHGIVAANRQKAAEHGGDSTRSWADYLNGDLPFGRPAQPGEVGDLVAFLCSPRASYISGTVITVDAGMVYR